MWKPFTQEQGSVSALAVADIQVQKKKGKAKDSKPSRMSEHRLYIKHYNNKSHPLKL